MKICFWYNQCGVLFAGFMFRRLNFTVLVFVKNVKWLALKLIASPSDQLLISLIFSTGLLDIAFY